VKLYEPLKTTIETGSGERKIHSFLKDNPVLIWGLCCNVSGHDDRVISEFKLGTKYRADFIVLHSYSGVWEINFIELEPANVPLFNKKGNPSDRFNGALQQIRDRREFVNDSSSTLKDEIAKIAKEHDILYPEYSFREDLAEFVDVGLQDRDMHFRYNYHIVCSRRSLNTKEELKKKGAFFNENINVATYDRLLHIARCFDEKRFHFEQ